MTRTKWNGWTPNAYERLQQERLEGKRVDAVTTGGGNNPFAPTISGSRLAMWESQQAQYRPLTNPEEAQQQAGTERDLAKATWSIKFDCDDPVLIVAAYPSFKSDSYTVQHHAKPEWYVVYQDTRTKEIGYLHIPNYLKHHTAFGYTLKETPAFRRAITPGEVIQPGTIIKHGPSLLPCGGLGMGREVNVSYFGTFGTNEDACEASFDVRDLFAGENFKEIEITLQQDEILTNHYGEGDNYQPLPPVGSIIGGNGLLAIRRKLRNIYDPINLSKKNLKRLNVPFDKPVYTDIDAEVVDIRVEKSPTGHFKKFPKAMCAYLDNLHQNTQFAHRQVLMQDANWKRTANYRRHPSMHIAVVAAEQRLGDVAQRQRPQPTYGDKPFVYRIVIVTRSILRPTLGHKFTNKDGGKFVIGVFKKHEDMPTDKWGRSAHFNANPSGVSNRNNSAQLYHQYLNDACFHARRTMLAMKDKHEQLEYLLEFYKKASAETYHAVMNHTDEHERWEHLETVLRGRIDLTHQIGDPSTTLDGTRAVKQSKFRPPKDVVTFRDSGGTRRTSIVPVRVANVYIVALEKIGAYSSACNVFVRQALGFAAKLDSADKKVAQHSEQSNRLNGESEFRSLFAHAGAEVTRYIQRGSSYKAINHQLDSIYGGYKGYLPKGDDSEWQNRGVELANHHFDTYGFRIVSEATNDEESFGPEDSDFANITSA